MNFKKIPDYNYWVFDNGEVKNIKTGKILKPHVGKNGYKYVSLSLNGKIKSFYIHRLVAELFLEKQYKKEYVCHEDGDKLNNFVKNLYWGSRSENELDKRKHGTHHQVNKIFCPLGHPLVEKNLKTQKYNKNTMRQCKACARARSRRHYEELKGLASKKIDFKKLADVYFELIMENKPTKNIERILKEKELL